MPTSSITKSSTKEHSVSTSQGGNMDGIKVSENYDQFTTLVANRDVGQGHVDSLKRAFEEYGNLTRVQPILVNEKMEIIDGQHRFTAAKELGLPIYFIVYPGLGIREARSMNILHKGWKTVDYARSYSESGDASYTRYLRLLDEFELSHSIILLTVQHGADNNGIYAAFRNGEFTLTPEQFEEARETLQKITQLLEFVPNVNNPREFAIAVLRSMHFPDYDHERMVAKLSRVGASIPSYSSIEDYQRALEDAYNRDMREGSRVRLF